MKKEKVVLCILDGFGIREERYGNAIKNALKPNLDYLFNTYPSSLLDASGVYVGLPEGQMGNSEVGHMNIGAGRIVHQSLSLINEQIENGLFKENKSFLNAFKHVTKFDSTLHLFILLSDGGVHSHIDHLLALMDLVKQKQVKHLHLHLFLDGRDVAPKSSITYIKQVQDKIKELGIGVIASISGRYYAMDRDNNLNRTMKAYETIANLKGQSFDDPLKYIEEEYVRLKNASWEVSDEFIISAYNKSLNKGLGDNDSVIYLNFRPDRTIQLSTMLTNSQHYNGKVSIKQINNLYFVSMMKYADSVKAKIAFKLDELNDLLGEIVAREGLYQLRIAETEKYAHVTYFFDGSKKYDGIELPVLKNCKRILIDSPKVATYDLKPQMSAYEISKALNDEINKEIHDLVIVNFANCDMVGHSAVYDATIKAVEVVDECVGSLYEVCLKNNYILIVTADHGNADMIFDLEDNLVSSHTTSKVPFIVCKKKVVLSNGKLGDIAPSILSLLGVSQPQKMSGINLIKKGEN